MQQTGLHEGLLRQRCGLIEIIQGSLCENLKSRLCTAVLNVVLTMNALFAVCNGQTTLKTLESYQWFHATDLW